VPFLGLLLSVAIPARGGEAWLLSLEAPAAIPLGQPQSSLFRPGALPAATGYRSLHPNVMAGLRLRAGALTNGPAPAARNVRDPGLGGLGGLSLALRARPLARGDDPSRSRGLWVEVAGGGGLTGTLLRATAEAGLGWNFRAGKVVLGPSLRYLQVIQPADQLESRDARLALVGVEVGFFDPRPAAPVVTVAVAAPAAPRDSDADGILDAVDRCPQDAEDKDDFEDADGCPDFDNDRDGIVDQLDRCPGAAEVVNTIDDEDGCPDEGLIELKGDRVVLDERVLFDTERARVKTAARPHLAAIVLLWKQHPDWKHMTIEGHTDVRGPDRFNDWLSEERAERVRNVLVELGLPPNIIDTKGYGRARPRDPSTTPEAHQANRRVEFVVDQVPAPASAPAPVKPVAPPPVAPTPVTPPPVAPTPVAPPPVAPTPASPPPAAPPPVTPVPVAPPPVAPPPVAPKPVAPPPFGGQP
jgi:outer membrane protein OmpA-like peptidoglycan-associated protein